MRIAARKNILHHIKLIDMEKSTHDYVALHLKFHLSKNVNFWICYSPPLLSRSPNPWAEHIQNVSKCK